MTRAALSVLVLAPLVFATACGDGAASREEMERRYEEVISSLDEKIEEVEAALRSATGDSREGLERRLQELRSARDDASRRLSDLRSATREQFEEMREEFESSLDSLRRKVAGLVE
jgi:DNA anti-recombination protein RmuC